MRIKTLCRQRLLLLMLSLESVYLLGFTGATRLIVISWGVGLILYVLHVVTLHRGKRWLGRMFLIATLVTAHYGITECEQIGSLSYLAPFVSYLFIRTAVSRIAFYARRTRPLLVENSPASALSTASV